MIVYSISSLPILIFGFWFILFCLWNTLLYFLLDLFQSSIYLTIFLCLDNVLDYLLLLLNSHFMLWELSSAQIILCITFGIFFYPLLCWIKWSWAEILVGLLLVSSQLFLFTYLDLDWNLCIFLLSLNFY